MTFGNVRIHDTATDEIIDREMTKAEVADYQNDIATREATNAAAANALAVKTSAYEKLGLTAEEIASLL